MRTSETPSDRRDVTKRGHVGACDLGCLFAGALDGLGDDLDPRNSCPVVVDQRVVGAVDPSGRATHVQGLSGVLLHMGTLDPDAVGVTVHVDIG